MADTLENTTNDRHATTGPARWVRPATLALDLVCLALLAGAALVGATGGYRGRFGETVVSLTSPWRPLVAAVVLVGLRLLIARRPTPASNLAFAGRRIAAAWVPLLLTAPLVLYVWVPFHWDRARLGPLSGDEPHYLIIVDALVRDHSLNVFPAYARDRVDRRIVGPVDWRNHCRGENDRWYSLHGVGLPILVAPAFSLGGVLGVRLLLAALAGLVPFVVWWCARLAGIGRSEAIGVAQAVTLGLPFAAVAGQIYPDLLSGVLVLALVALVWTAQQRIVPRGFWVAAALILALLPWLHVKNALAACVLAAALALVRRQEPARRDGFRWWPWLVGLQALSAVLLLTYHLAAFGHILGPYRTGPSADATLYQATMIFLGLHFDQAQGLFVQQPLFLLGLAGLPIFLRRAPFVAATTAAAYIAVVGPNAFHSCWYGCFSMSGRFMWGVAAFWALPIASLYASLGRAGRRVVALVAVPALAYQWMLSDRVYRDPGGFFTFWTSYDRNSLFASNWRRLLPSFYDFDRYPTLSPNVAAFVVALALVALGVWLARGRER